MVWITVSSKSAKSVIPIALAFEQNHYASIRKYTVCVDNFWTGVTDTFGWLGLNILRKLFDFAAFALEDNTVLDEHFSVARKSLESGVSEEVGLLIGLRRARWSCTSYPLAFFFVVFNQPFQISEIVDINCVTVDVLLTSMAWKVDCYTKIARLRHTKFADVGLCPTCRDPWNIFGIPESFARLAGLE